MPSSSARPPNASWVHPDSAAGWRNGSAAPRRSHPIPRSAAAIARCRSRDRRRRGQHVRHVGRELRVADARRGTVEPDEQRFAVLRPGGGDRRACRARSRRVEGDRRDPRSPASRPPSTASSSRSNSAVPAGSSSTRIATRPGVPGHHDGRALHAVVAGEERDVRLVLHLLTARREQGGWRVAVRDVAPGPREELRVGLVPAQRGDADRVARRSPR